MWRLITLSLALLGGQANALSIIFPQCTTSEGAEFYNIGEMAGDLRLTTFNNRASGYREVILAHCPSQTQVIVWHAENEELRLRYVRETIVEMIASAETYTFQNLADRFDVRGLSSDVTTLEHSECICAERDN